MLVQLVAKPFSELCKVLKGMYFYYCVPGKTTSDTFLDLNRTCIGAKCLHWCGFLVAMDSTRGARLLSPACLSCLSLLLC